MKRRILISILVCFTIILLQHTSLAQTFINGGDVFGFWQREGSPFIINADITIPSDTTLVIESGVRVEFQDHYALDVQGVILAVGTESDSIIFTINDTSGFSDRNSTSGGWEGIRLVDLDKSIDSSRFEFCRFEYAKAVGDVWHINAGGALTVINFDKVIVSHSLFYNNSAGGDTTEVPTGGAIHLAWSDIALLENTFINNVAVSGGAIQMHESNPMFRENLFKNNSASDNSGAIAVGWKSSTSFDGDRFENNHAENNGGAVTCWDSTATTFRNVFFQNNQSNDGGAIYATSANIDFMSTTFLNNCAKSIGGGINAFRSEIQLDSCSIVNDTSYVFGGGAGFYESVVIIDNSEFNDNSSGVLGGALHSNYSHLEVNNCMFNRDTSESGGAIFAWYNNLKIKECEFRDNSAKHNSGAIYSENGRTHIMNCTFDGNRSIWGGAVGFYNDTTSISGSRFMQNSAEHGGALNSGFSDLRLSNLIFKENHSIWGGGASFGNCDLQLDSTLFQSNYASSNAGGMEYFTDTLIQSESYSLTINNTNFEDNFGYFRGALEIQQRQSQESILGLEIGQCNFLRNSSDRGGNILISGMIDDFHFFNSIIGENRSVLRTSGCQFSNYAIGTVSNCLFYSNKTAGGGTAAAIGANGKITFTNCTFVNNKGISGAALTQRRTSSVILFNSIMWGNIPRSCLVNAVSDTVGCDLSIYYSDIQFGLDSIMVSDSISSVNWVLGNIDEDPSFVDTITSNYKLSDSSACLGVGETSIEHEGMIIISPNKDLGGAIRPNPENSKPDLGAYENGTLVSVQKQSLNAHKFQLHQNHPNPFNPSTRIKYQIPVNVKRKTLNVRLKVYDILGREVATLVNKEQSTGNYEVEFNASNLTSGI
ncbi:MAG: hypothetical protein ABFS12_15170, partial [Bacteroidota bacterium]